MTAQVSIAGETYEIGQLTIKQTAAVLESVKYLRSLSETDILIAVTSEGADVLVRAVHQLTGASVEAIERLPIHEFLDTTNKLAEILLRDAGSYFNNEVTQALSRLTETLNAASNKGVNTH